jgi:phage gp46-like protein
MFLQGDNVDFQGDMLLVDSPDGGDLLIENGLIKNDNQFSTAVYLSLFGGNQDDPGKTKSKRSWWANLFYSTDSERLRSRFQFVINGFPMTVKYIREAEAAALLDLEWLKTENIADKINLSIKSTGKNTFNMDIDIKANMETLYKNTYSLQWEGGKNHAL